MAFVVCEQRHLLETRVLDTKLDGPVCSLERLEDLGLLQEIIVNSRCRGERRGTSGGSDLPVEQSEEFTSHVVVERERGVGVDSMALLSGNLQKCQHLNLYGFACVLTSCHSLASMMCEIMTRLLF